MHTGVPGNISYMPARDELQFTCKSERGGLEAETDDDVTLYRNAL